MERICLHGGVEYRKLKLSQFEFCSDDIGKYVVYTEMGQKIRAVDIRIKVRTNVFNIMRRESNVA